MTARSKSVRSKKSAQAAAPRIDLQFAERELPGGLIAIVVRNPGVPTMAVGMSLRASQLDEGPREHGLASMVGVCLEEGTLDKSSVELAEAVESIGGSLSTHEGGARILCPADEAKRACALLREVVLEPAFRPADVRRVQLETVTEIATDLEEPSTVAGLRFRAEVYGAHPFARPSWGSAEDSARFRPADLRRFHAKWYRPARGYVAMAWPFECERGLDLLARAMRGFDGPSPERLSFEAPPLPSKPREVHLPMPREQVHVFVGHPGIRRDNVDYHELLVMDHVLGTGPGFTSRIPKRLRDELGLCYSVGATISGSAGEEPGTFRAYIGTSAEHRKLAIEGFAKEIRELQREPPTSDELSVAQDYLAGSFVLGLEHNSSLLSYAIRARRHNLGYDYLERFPDLVRRVTCADVQRVAQQYLHPDRFVTVSAGA